ncbi:SPOR domain-containing protein [Deinococcus multiflagellatus]|uniref:SPOR domain-containing protein n=1 Tax=Deinococcus multiflagellatus TaxID=1656887 RepID=A0ABW1ZG13_9DEIO
MRTKPAPVRPWPTCSGPIPQRCCTPARPQPDGRRGRNHPAQCRRAQHRPACSGGNGRNRSVSLCSGPPAEPAPAPDGPTYLQVGAFDRVESAQNLVQQLRDLGYAPTVNAPEGRKVTVLVGPYTGDALQRTEGRLSANGLDHFRVR